MTESIMGQTNRNCNSLKMGHGCGGTGIVTTVALRLDLKVLHAKRDIQISTPWPSISNISNVVQLQTSPTFLISINRNNQN
jgi:hypothetical protein